MREPTAFSFILTREDGARVYGNCLVFDEDFPDELKDQVMLAINVLIIKIGHIEISKENTLYTQKSICIISYYPFFNQFKEVLKQIYRLHLSKNDIPIEV